VYSIVVLMPIPVCLCGTIEGCIRHAAQQDAYTLQRSEVVMKRYLRQCEFRRWPGHGVEWQPIAAQD